MARMGKILAICLAVFACFALAVAVPQASAAQKFRVAIVLPGSITDQSFNQTGYEGLKRIEKELGAEVAYTENVADADQLENLRDYARRGYDLVIAHGGQFDDAAMKVAAQFPKVKFFVTNGRAKGPNISGGGINPTHMGYLSGIIAGTMSKTGKLAWITGASFPLNDANAGSFATGAKRVNPKAELSVVFTGNWDDVAKAKEAAIAQIARGVDVLVPALNLASLGVIEAAHEKGVYAIGFSRDQLKVAPDTVLCTIIQDYGIVNFYVAKLVKEGKFEGGKMYELGAETPGVTGIGTPNKVVPKKALDEVKKAVQDLVSGKVKPYPWP